jgi:hypothetical protein
MNTAVSFELAQLLKEKEFDLKVRSSFCGGKLHFDTNAKGNYNDINWIRSWRNSPIDDVISAPTISEVVMWLYEKYGIWIVCSQALDTEMATVNLYWFWVAVQEGEEIAYQYFDFKSPTEAYKAGIQHTLNNLI